MEFIVKQRLVGAIVLVALGVIFIPMLLEGPDRNLVPEMQPLPEPEERQASRPLGAFPVPDGIPAEPDSQVIHSDPPVPETAVETGMAPPGEPAPEPGAPQATPLALPDPPEAAPAREQEPPAEAVEATSEEPGPLGNWVVQVGSFSSEKNALALRERLREEGFATQVEKVVIAGKAHYRVRVGPYLKRADADADLNKLAKRFTELKGRVLAYP